MKYASLVLAGLVVAGASVAIAGEPKTPAATPTPTAGAAPDPSVESTPRKKVSCEDYRREVEKTSKTAIFNTRIKAGSWGSIPEPLRKLPPGAKLCGADSMGQVVIASPLYGKKLEAYYGPLYTKLEFSPITCEVSNNQTTCKSKRHRDFSVLITDAGKQAYVIGFYHRQRARMLSAGHQ